MKSYSVTIPAKAITVRSTFLMVILIMFVQGGSNFRVCG